MIDEVEVLSGLTAMMQVLDERQKLLQTVVDQSALLLGVPRVSAWLFDEYRTKLIAGARAGMPLHSAPDFQYRLGEGLIGWIAENVAAIRVSNAEDDPRFLPRTGRVEPLKAFLGVPLISSRRCIGVLCSVAPEAGHFSRHHEQLLGVVAGLCSQPLLRANTQGR
jgi:GAF domain-containing protein